MKRKQKQAWMSPGPALRAIREGAGITGAEVGRRAGWAQSRISQVEGGKYDMRVGTLRRYLNSLGLRAHLVVVVKEEDGVETEHWVEI